MLQLSQRRKSPVNNSILENIFSRGHVIYACATSDGLRMVTIEDLSSLYLAQTANLGTRSAAQHLAVAKHATVENAFKQALATYNGTTTVVGALNPTKRKVKVIPQKPNSKLDYWLTDHKGTMRALQDEDLILCLLEGLRKPNSSSHDRITLEGAGYSFKMALHDAFRQLADLDSHSNPISIEVD